ncbi:hypothetical protein K0M31_015160 [Melipona bicolor]|uniref:Uncharacterized protein n=1 Tax=Melipona bicolor TaxID=60889 RepID=A0AA40KFI3_9HYME|nr:hypothetical protein K0M31_015160 [Melipona bicolor]
MGARKSAPNLRPPRRVVASPLGDTPASPATEGGVAACGGESGVATPTVASVQQFHVAWWFHPASFTTCSPPVRSSSFVSRVVSRVGVCESARGGNQQAAATATAAAAAAAAAAATAAAATHAANLPAIEQRRNR